MKKSIWLFSAGLMAIASPAYAQQTDTDGQAAQPTDGATAEAAAVDNQATSTQPQEDTGEIVVTATRRNQALSDVPLAVSALTADSLANTGATDIKQMQQISPSLIVTSTQSEAGASRATIRGIGTVGDNPGLESSVGVFIDGVYRSRTGTALNELGPIERVEVLRGPQGTLFGRNTSAGLISVITAKPKFNPEFGGEATIGNYGLRRFEASVTGPLSGTIAARLDGVFVKRDGFVEDVVSGRDINDRNRWLLRGQALFEPSDNFSFRLIADYAKRNEECCAAPYVPASDYVAGVGRQPSTIKPLIEGLGGIVNDNPGDRKVAVSPGRTFRQDVKDWGVSGEGVYDMGWAELTSITAYRYNNLIRGNDVDYNNLDIVYRPDDGTAFNRFKTFSQELRLQGTSGILDWLVGGYFANEKLTSRDSIRYGNDFGRVADCLVANNFALSFAQNPSPSAQFLAANLVQAGRTGCVNPALAGSAAGALAVAPSSQLVFNALAGLGQFANGPGGVYETLAARNFLAPVGPGGSLVNVNPFSAAPDFLFANAGNVDTFRQSSNNFALFTHNIFKLTDRLNFTAGLRWTNETKKLNANFTDNNVGCLVYTGTSLAKIPCLNPAALQGNFNLSGKRTEHKLSGTAVLSYKPTDDLLVYTSFSRGYKAGGFNLDRSVLTRQSSIDSFGYTVFGAICPTSGPVPTGCAGNASINDLEFKPETNNALELGAKFNGRLVDINVALFRQLFDNFQLNTFNGVNFEVANVNSCKQDLNGADSDNSNATGACTGDTRAGVKSRGFEVELFSRPIRNVTFNAGVTMADTRYRDNLVGTDGRPLSNALFQLPGRQVSGSSKWTITSSLGWTPPIGTSGIHGLAYIDMRHQSGMNTGSDLDIEKYQKAFSVFNARIGLTGPQRAWGIELWANNIFKKDYYQVAFDAFAQGGCTQRGAQAGYCAPPYPANRSNQLYGVFMGDPRTFGLTLKGRFAPAKAPVPEYVAPPAPPPPAPPATQTCADGSVILATDSCPLPPPPPPPPPAPERG